MFKELRRSFLEFRQSFDGLPLAGPRLVDREGTRIGYLERLVATGNALRLEGWADADEILVEGNADVVRIEPDLARPDVRAHLGDGSDLLGFAVTLPGSPDRIILRRNGEDLRFTLPKADLFSRMMGETKVVWAFSRLCFRIAPDIMLWVRTRDPNVRQRIVAAIRSERRSRPRLNPSFLDGSGWEETGQTPVTIIMPVYQGHDLMVQAVDRVRRHTDLPWHLVVIDDASPDKRIGPFLDRLANELGPDRMTLLSNPQNMGFIGSVNRGFDIARERGDHVVLLNTDAFVSEGWASRVLAPILADPSISSVTPMSSNAEIANIPVICTAFTLNEGEADSMDQVARRLSGPEAIADAPTGVGFCMAMNIDMLRRIPQFDPAFGKGYGEEVDWCQRAIREGGRNVLNAGVFVEHVGGQSFGSEAKRQLIQENSARITHRYPEYDQQVQDFIKHDPLRTQRLAVGLSLAARRVAAKGEKLTVILGHAMSGGAETYLRQRVHMRVRQTGFAVVIRAMPGAAWQMELHSTVGTTVASTQDISVIESILEFGGPLGLVYSCGVGGGDPLAIPDFLARLGRRSGNTLEVAFNDFFPISPSYTLLNRDGTYTGVPDRNSTDPAHSYLRADGSSIPLTVWSDHWAAAISEADKLTVFSESSAEIVRTAWPDKASHIQIRPHMLPHSIAPMDIGTKSGKPVIGVLGNISGPKGAQVLQDLSAELSRRRAGRLVLIGNIDPNFSLTAPSAVHGSYDLSDLGRIMRKYGVSRWFLPSVWPETFCFAVHEMIATGLPVWCFDLGAQAEAVRNAVSKGRRGGIVPLTDGRYSMDELISRLTGPDNQTGIPTDSKNPMSHY
ncbi:glycosyltransferase [Paracoccus aerodenitrificans]|uniref:glycosyltransferase n=1 Tax=Paracoccus aerodenitrificans TaxID=3017781 RepID=UPI0022F0A18C|nr:glycosyltransferase [Paracoccus aerodenitrificans]WBU63886.1 glycosyltransferase [Paracoccus aerodenitrificans]